MALAGVVLVLGGAAGSAAASPRSSDGASDGRDPVGPVPAGLERFYGQELAWTGCGEFATAAEDEELFANPALQCTRVQVPLDYRQPGGRTAGLAVLRMPAGDPAARIGSLLVNPGGPGASGVATAASMAEAVAGMELGERFDLVGFDPRGVGASEPAITCFTAEERQAEQLDTDSDTDDTHPTVESESEAEARAFAQQCAELSGLAVLATVGTENVARDLDVLRAVLGDEQLTYLGYSYGTEIGTEYAEQFPRNVRAMVLDGVVNVGESPLEQMVDVMESRQQAFDGFVDWCLRQPDCWLGDTPQAQASARFQELARPLQDQPLPTAEGALSYDDVMAATQVALYEHLWPQLNQGLIQLVRGDGSILLDLAGSFTDLDLIAGNEAVNCVDEQRVTDPAVAREIDRRTREVAPAFDDGSPPSAEPDPCAFWPVPAASEPPGADVADVEGLLPPILVVSTTVDPATPYQGGVELAREIDARLVTFEGYQHTAALQGVACVDDAVSAYLIDLTLPPEGLRCTPS